MLAQHRLLTVGETALILRQSQRSVRDKIARGEIPSLRVGVGPRAPIRVDAGELERWLYRHLSSTSYETPRVPAAAAVHDHLAAAGKTATKTPPARVCRHGEIVPAGRSCPLCKAEKLERSRRRGSTTGRGYGGAHRALRKRLASLVASGHMRCARCGGLILPGTPWDLGHADGDRTRYHGAEHAACNRGGLLRERGRSQGELNVPTTQRRRSDPTVQSPPPRAPRHRGKH